ncbi:MAG: o-succinylbenzoate synthase [Alicyclobacillus sp.]|nr:o-succinylbenzoate synthase [Alicyclobacillus sp.]
MGLKIEEVVVHRLVMPLKTAMTTSYGTLHARDLLLVEVITDEGLHGWGESVAMHTPWYTEETTETVAAILRHHLIPLLWQRSWDHPREFLAASAWIRGNAMAKFALEGALWDAWAQAEGVSLAQALGGSKPRVAVGVSLGIEPLPQLLARMEAYAQAGYQRIKIKIQPGWDVTPVAAIRQAFPGVPLMVDANGSYRPDDWPQLLALDAYDLLMIEQPFPAAAWTLHARLQAELRTPVCLDESVATAADAQLAVELGACRVLNLKPGRLGGLQTAVDVATWARRQGVEVWCGGMYETGIGRAMNIALCSLDAFTLPADLAASQHYWHADIIQPEVVVEHGTVAVPCTPGLGFTVDVQRVQAWQQDQEHFRPPARIISLHP